jgi:hypothetical protein
MRLRAERHRHTPRDEVIKRKAQHARWLTQHLRDTEVSMEATDNISHYTYHDHDGQSPYASGIDELCIAVCQIDAPGEHVGAEREDELRFSQLKPTSSAGDTHKLRDD